MIKRVFVLGALTGALVFACSSSTDNPTDAGQDTTNGTDTGTKETGNSDAQPDAGGPDGCMPAVPPAPTQVDAEVQCDLLAQDCKDPCNPKCSFFALEAGTSIAAGNFVACGPLAGEGGVDQPCTRPTNVAGYDTCAKGFCCVSSSTPADASTLRVCRPVCAAAGNCLSGEFCEAMTVPTLPISQGGICARKCDPWSTACASGDGCVTYLDITNTFQLTCGVTGSSAAGATCAGGNDCLPGAACWRVGDSGTSACAPYCDGTHLCSSGTCTAPAGTTGFKICL
jgi:hypothetical protein